MLVTVFTPLYNREKSILDVYKSLCCQSDVDFEWLVINDGSTDGSSQIMNSIISNHDGKFSIQYHTQSNMGLNRTINKGMDLAKGILFFRLDSDDVALPNAIELIHRKYPLIKDEKRLCGVAFRSLHFDGSYVGYHPFSCDKVTDFCSYRHLYNAVGDRNEVMKLDVYRKYKFPEFEGENFCPEALVWNRIAKEYDCLYVPEAIYKKGFEDDSITAKVYQTLKRCCQGTCTLYEELTKNESIPYKSRFWSAVRYYRYAFFAGRPLFNGMPKHVVFPAFPVGLAVILYDFIKHPNEFIK